MQNCTFKIKHLRAPDETVTLFSNTYTKGGGEGGLKKMDCTLARVRQIAS